MMPEFNTDILPAHFAVQSLLEEIFIVLEKKLEFIAYIEAIDKPLSHSIRRGEDSYLSNLLRSLHGVCETCLPSVLNVMINWYEHQQRVSISEIGEARNRAIKRTLVASYLFCVVLIEILPQIHFHPNACDVQINFIIDNSFKQISYRDPAVYGNNYENSLIVVELFEEVIGVLSQSHSKQIQKTFLSQLNEYRKELPSSSVTVRSIISLLMGMKYFRVKTNQVSEFETGVSFLNELGTYFLEVDFKQKDLKHALAGLLVEILLPMAAQIKTETNIPALISFVDKLYGPTYELVNKKQHKMAAYPLLTCLLCISQSKFFLSTWVQFLNLTLANLKNKDSKVSRLALESLHRLIWVYIIRINCEGNTTTRSRLESICGSLFPRGSRNVVPRDAPLNIFVKIIHLIAQFKVDFAFKEIIFDLLGCTRASRQLAIYPERMNIGIRALMVIVDGLQQKEGPPAMPRSLPLLASATVHRTKRSYITHPLSMDVAQKIGLEQYYPHCRKAFDVILRTLDAQIGRSFMLTSPQMRGKDDVIGADIKPKLDLFRICVAAIPRLLPDPMSHQDLIEMLTRICIHIDKELSATACQSLQNLITECPKWREDIIHNFIRFFTNTIQDTFPTLIESMVRLLLQLLSVWKASIIMEQQRKLSENPVQNHTNMNGIASTGSDATQSNLSTEKVILGHKFIQAPSNVITTSSSNTNTSHSFSDGSPQLVRSLISSISIDENINSVAFVLHCVEGLCITLLCQLRPQIKKVVISLLREVKQMLELFAPKQHETAVIDVLDQATPYIIAKYLPHFSATEKNKWPNDFASICELLSNLEPDSNLVNADNGNEYMRWDVWACALSGYCEKKFLLTQCSIASSFAWSILYVRFTLCNQLVDPSNPQNESRSSLLRSSKSKSSSWTLCGEILSQENYLSLWQKYLVMVFALCNSTPNFLPNSINQFRSMSPCLTITDTDVNRSMISSVRMTRISNNYSQLMQKATTMIRWDATDVADSVVLGIGSINPECFGFLLEELNLKGILRELNDRKNESNVRRRKRKDILRLQIIRIIEFAVFRGLFEYNSSILERHSNSLPQTILELFDSIRFHVDSDNGRDLVLASMRLHFAKLISLIISSVPIELRVNLMPPETKRSLFALFRTICTTDRRLRDGDIGIFVEQMSIRAMCALISLGPMFECQGAIYDETSMFRWLEALMSSTNPMVDNLCEETLCIMLHLNEHHPRLLERVLQMCYNETDIVSIRCFQAISRLFSQRDFPCEYISLLCLCQSFASDIESSSVQQTAFLLIQLLRSQFLDSTFSPPSLTPINELSNYNVDQQKDEGVVDFGKCFPTNQLAICRQLSRQYPQLTMPIFSEICFRLDKSSRPNRQLSLLTILPEWLKNVQLVDSNCDITFEHTAETDENGWGSEESTQLILNNLLYMTAKLANEHDNEIRNLWRILATSWPANLSIIVFYLFIMLTLSLEDILPLAKKISSYLLEISEDRFVSMLVGQLQRVGDPFKAQLCRSEMAPFYRWQSNIGKDEAEDGDDKSHNKENLDRNFAGKDPLTVKNASDGQRMPNQLPMPPYGGNYCRLSDFFQNQTQVVPILSRNNLALFLLCDLVRAETGNCVNWNLHLPKILHMALVNLDAHRMITCAYSRQTLLNICIHFASNDYNSAQVANAILKNQRNNLLFEFNHSNKNQNNAISTSMKSQNQSGDCEKRFFSNELIFTSKTELLIALVYLFSNNQHVPLWDHEEVTQCCWRPESVRKLECLVRHLSYFLQDFIPDLARNWTNFAIDFAITSNNRHLAGRSFQVASALGLTPAPFLHRILSRLTEVVGDSSEETQSYITDLFLCLQNMAQNITNINALTRDQSITIQAGHSRSISYTQHINIPFNSPLRKTAQKKDMRHSLLIGNELLSPDGDAKPLMRSRSATTLKMSDSTDVALNEEDVNTLSQLLFIGVAMLESDLDNEFLLGLNCVNKLLLISGKERLNCLRKLEECIIQHGWDEFPGIVGFSLRGTLYPSGCEWAISTFCKCIRHLNEPVVSKSANDSFALMLISSLPHFIHNFDSPTQLCSNYVQSITMYCQSFIDKDGLDISSSDHPICNLITVMDQFRDRSFPRDRAQWVKCVINYLIDAFKPDTLQLILFLTEMLEKSAVVFHPILLDMLYLLFSYGSLNDASPTLINAKVIRVISKHIHGVNSRDASRILKIITDQWNSISINRLPYEKCLTVKRKPEFELHYERTLTKGNGEETLSENTEERMSTYKVRDRLISVLSASGLRARSPKHSSMLFSQSSNEINQKTQENTAKSTKTHASSSVRRIDAAVALTDQSDLLATLSQQRLSDEITSLERNSSPNSLSAIGAPYSGANSGELASLRTTDSFPRVFKEFDFLEAEHDSISESTESCFNWLSTMRTPRCGACHTDNGLDDGNQDQEEDVLDEDDFYNDEEEDEMEQSVFDPNKVFGVGNFGSPQLGTSSRHSLTGNNGGNLNAYTNEIGRRKGGFVKRPLSRASDSNDVSSDRTPVQSSKHSDDEEDGSSPSSSLSEDENKEESASVIRHRSIVEEQKKAHRQTGVMMMKSSQERFSLPSPSTESLPRSPPPPSATNNQMQLGNALDVIHLPFKMKMPYSKGLTSSAADSTITASSVHPNQCKNEETSSSILHFLPTVQQKVEFIDNFVAPLECSHHTSGSIEHTWNTMIARLGNEQEGELTSGLITLFTQLLRESAANLASILRDASHLLTIETTLLQMPIKGGISTQLSHSLNVVLKLADCPFLFVTPLFLRSSNLLTSQQFALFEIREHFDTYIERRAQAIRALNSLKSSLKLMIISGRNNETGENSQHVVYPIATHNQQFTHCNQQKDLLCKSLHRLSFQLLLMLEKLLEMIQFVHQSTNSQDYDMTPAVVSMHKELLAYQANCALDEFHLSGDFHSGRPSDAGVGTTQTSSSSTSSLRRGIDDVMDLSQARDMLVLHTTNKQFRQAFNKLAMLRSQYCSSGQFGCCEQTNVDVLLLHFCRNHHALRMWALVGSLEQLRCWCTQLKEANVQLGILVRNMVMMAQSTEAATASSGTEQCSGGESFDREEGSKHPSG